MVADRRRYWPDRRTCCQHAGPNVLRVRRCGGHADWCVRRKVPRRIRGASSANPRGEEQLWNWCMADLVKFTIDGRELEAPAGTLLINAAKQNGIAIPAFCYYDGLSLQAACRMCLVEVEKTPKLQVACTLPVTEGMVVTPIRPSPPSTQSHSRVFVDQSSARLSGLRQGRGMRTAGHGVSLRGRREPFPRRESSCR